MRQISNASFKSLVNEILLKYMIVYSAKFNTYMQNFLTQFDPSYIRTLVCAFHNNYYIANA